MSYPTRQLREQKALEALRRGRKKRMARVITAWLTTEEKARIVRYAYRQGMSVSEYVGRALKVVLDLEETDNGNSEQVSVRPMLGAIPDTPEAWDSQISQARDSEQERGEGWAEFDPDGRQPNLDSSNRAGEEGSGDGVDRAGYA